MVVHGVSSPRWLRPVAETTLGIVLAVVPLALWVAWSPALLVAVLVIGAVCAALLVAIYRPLPDDAPQNTQEDTAHAVLPDGFVEELHRLSPLVYHHGLEGKPSFRRTMEKLRRLIR